MTAPPSPSSSEPSPPPPELPSSPPPPSEPPPSSDSTPASASASGGAWDGGGRSEFGIPFLGTVPTVENPYPPTPSRGFRRMGERWQQMRQLFYLKGEGLYKEEDSRVVNTIAFGLGFLVLLVAATYFALFVLIRPARDADKKTHEPFDVPAAETV